MLFDVTDTIVAIASATGAGARGIVRLTGPRVADVVLPQMATKLPFPVESAQMLTGSWDFADDTPPLPCLLYVWPRERSFTRQPTIEIHTIACTPLLERIVIQLTGLGARLAQPGEFTLRSFLAGRIDLTQAEAVLGVIDAHDHLHLNSALEQLAGGLSQPLSELRHELLNLCADIEAGLDFVDEDISFISSQQIQTTLVRAELLVSVTLEQISNRGQSDTRPRIVLYGQPNTGKSTLWNVLAGSGRAIVSAIPGTTRDYLEAEIDLGGRTCLLVDTAGRDDQFSHPIDASAQTLAARVRETADLRVLCLDATRPLTHWESEQLRDPTTIAVIANKADGDTSSFRSSFAAASPLDQRVLYISAHQATGLDRLIVGLANELQNSFGSDGQVVASTALRCRDSLLEAREALATAYDLNSTDAGHELVAAEIRNALVGLGHVLGVIYTDDILDRVFQRFCIGK